MKKIAINVFVVVFALVSLALVAGTTQAGQNVFAYVAKNYVTGGAQLLNTDADGSLLMAQGSFSALNVATSSVLVTGTARVAKVSVLVAGSAGAIYDSATAASAAAANEIAVVPAAVGVTNIDFPVTRGIVYIPGASQVVSISYN